MDREKGTMVDASFICLCATCVKANFFRAPLLLSRFDKATGEEFFYVARYEEREEAWSTLLRDTGYVYNVCPMHKRHVQIS